MAILKIKDARELPVKERADKLQSLKFELVRKNAPANKSSKIKAKEIKKAIARILTLKE